AGLSRCEGLAAAQKLVPVRGGVLEKEMSPRLAGALAHATLPAMAGSLTLDAVLLGRAAAWLVLAESMVKSPTPAVDALWAPILFQAGREKQAAQIWKQSGVDPKKLLLPAHCWDFILGRPTSLEAFLFAANPANRQFAMPVLTYYARLNSIGHTLADAMPVIFGYHADNLAAFCDYAPYFYTETSIGGGRLLEGRWTSVARKQWVDLLADWPPSTLDFNEFPVGPAEMKSQLAADFAADQGELDESLRGFETARQVISLGYSDATGPLIPTAAATVKDLLVYGYEMTGLHLGNRYVFINQRWGVPQYARPLVQQAIHPEHGVMYFPFFGLRYGPGQRDLYDYPRLQYIEYKATQLNATNRLVFDRSTKTLDARLFPARCWLRPEMSSPQCWAMAHSGSVQLVPQLLARAHAEGGRLNDKYLLQYLVRWIHQDQVASFEPMRQKLAAALPEPLGLHISVWWKERFEPLNQFQRAQELEKLFWQNTASAGQIWAFENYVLARAYRAAARFYAQVAAIDDAPVNFSNFLGPEGLMLGILLDDEALMRAALEASASASYADMTMNAIHAAHRGDWRALGRIADQAIQRYEQTAAATNSMARMWKAVVPLIPALQDPAHADRERALALFPPGLTNSIALQWVLIGQSKLPVPDAIRFLGGSDTDPIRKALIYYLQRDKEKFAAHFERIRTASWFSGNRFVLVTYLRNELLDVPIPKDQPDLQPPGYLSLMDAIVEYKKTLLAQ
ncbi:MAG: hypothetical protein AB1705_25430, partial [Verrucomicrobiota bacterium]